MDDFFFFLIFHGVCENIAYIIFLAIIVKQTYVFHQQHVF